MNRILRLSARVAGGAATWAATWVLLAGGCQSPPSSPLPGTTPDAGTPSTPPSPPPGVASAWQFEHPLPQGNTLNAAWIAPDSREVWAVGQAGTVVHVTAQGATREALGTTALSLRAVTAAGRDVWAVGDGGIVLHGQGGKWSAELAGTTPLYAVWIDNGQPSAAGQGNLLWQRGAAGWQSSPLPGPRPDSVIRAAALSGKDLYLVGAGGRILHRAGATWSVEDTATSLLDWNSVTVTADGTAYAVGGGARIARRDAKSGKWTIEEPTDIANPLARAPLVAVFPLGAGVAAVGDDGTVLTRAMDGWHLGTALPASGVEAAAGSAAGAVAVGDSGLLLVRGPMAADPWQAAGTQLTRARLTALAAGGGAAYATAQDGSILRRVVKAGDPQWQVDYTPPSPDLPVLGIWANGEEAYAVGMGGTLLHHTAAGWQAESYSFKGRLDLRGVWVHAGATTDVYAVGSAVTDVSEEQAVILHKSGAGAWTSETIMPDLSTALYAVAGDDTGVVAAGSLGAILHREGDHWVREDQDQLQDVTILGLLPLSGHGDLLAVGTGGTVLQRAAGAQIAWARGAAPAAVTLHAAVSAGQDLWVVGEGGLAARRRGTAWQVDPTLFSGALNGIAVLGTDLLAAGDGGAILRRPMSAP